MQRACDTDGEQCLEKRLIREYTAVNALEEEGMKSASQGLHIGTTEGWRYTPVKGQLALCHTVSETVQSVHQYRSNNRQCHIRYNAA